MKELIIDKEFQGVIPALTDQEREQLETNILTEGIRDPLIVWNGILIDGHNRYEIAKEHGIDFDVVEMEFGSRAEAMAWAVHNQLGRRNLTNQQKCELGRKLRPAIRGTTPNTRETLADIVGVSTNTLQRYDYIQDNAPQETIEKVASGEMSINKAYLQTKPKDTETFSEFRRSYTDEEALEEKDRLLAKLPVRESKIGLPYQKKATECIRCIANGNYGMAIEIVADMLEDPTPATIALAHILLEAF